MYWSSLHCHTRLSGIADNLSAAVSSNWRRCSVQIQNLRRTRDLLLPRLLSGQIDVSNLTRTRCRMNAQDLPLTQLLDGAKQFIVPIFQRDYSWGTKHCQQLWNDILRVGADPNCQGAFSGFRRLHCRRRQPGRHPALAGDRRATTTDDCHAAADCFARPLEGRSPPTTKHCRRRKRSRIASCATATARASARASSCCGVPTTRH